AYIDLKFTSDMIVIKPWNEETGNILRIKPRANTANDLLISALSGDGSIISKAVLCVSPDAKQGYRSEEDVLLLASSTTAPALYTLADNKATSINVTPTAEGTEIGLTAGKTDGDVTLRFDNTSCVDGFCLVDRRTGYVEPITEGLEYTVHGDVAGRLYISSHDYSLSYSQERITIKVTNDVVCAAAAGNMHIDLCIYDLTGKPVAKASGDNGFAEVRGLYRGFYIVEASTPTGLRTLEKICMK
ncbi:MAG: hypothetical protein K2L75_09090, partial [Muribaculaceae bacterium]|nr:hypothetical protein [Muribaculaceae bacterium]